MTGKSTFHSRVLDSPLTFVGGETSSAEFTPPRNFRFSAAVYRLRKMPGFAAVNCCGLFRPRQMSGARNWKSETINRVHLEFAVFGEIPEVFPFETGRRADLPIVVAEFGFQI